MGRWFQRFFKQILRGIRLERAQAMLATEEVGFAAMLM
jgi:hypothetical protein